MAGSKECLDDEEKACGLGAKERSRRITGQVAEMWWKPSRARHHGPQQRSGMRNFPKRLRMRAIDIDGGALVSGVPGPCPQEDSVVGHLKETDVNWRVVLVLPFPGLQGQPEGRVHDITLGTRERHRVVERMLGPTRESMRTSGLGWEERLKSQSVSGRLPFGSAFFKVGAQKPKMALVFLWVSLFAPKEGYPKKRETPPMSRFSRFRAHLEGRISLGPEV